MAKAASLSRPSFSSILDTPASEIERPKPMPPGQYIWAVQGQPKFDKSSKKQTDFVEFTLKCLEAMDTVDSDDLDKWLTKKDGSKIKLTEVTKTITFYLTESALWRLKDFLAHCGLGEDSDESLKQLIAETAGCQVIGTIRHEPFQSGDGIRATIGATAPVEG